MGESPRLDGRWFSETAGALRRRRLKRRVAASGGECLRGTVLERASSGDVETVFLTSLPVPLEESQLTCQINSGEASLSLRKQ